MKNIHEIRLDEVYPNFDSSQDYPNFSHLSSIEIEPDVIGADQSLTDEDKIVITHSVDAIERAVQASGFQPLIVDFSLIMDQELRGLKGQHGYYHSFVSINTIRPEDTFRAYINSIFKEHRENPNSDKTYESIVTHADLFKSDIASICSNNEVFLDKQLHLPEFRNTDHVGAYGFSVRYVEAHSSNVRESIDKFLSNFSTEISSLQPDGFQRDEAQTFLLTIPFRRAKFTPVGQLAQFTNETTGSPGGALFVFIRTMEDFEGIPKRLSRIIRRIGWVLSQSAIGEAYGSDIQKKTLIDKATSTYGMAHPLKHRWGDVEGIIDELGELTLETPELSEDFVSGIHYLKSFTKSFGGWVDLAYILYYASNFSYSGGVDGKTKEKIFSGTGEFDLKSLLYPAENFVDLVGKTCASSMSLHIDDIDEIKIRPFFEKNYRLPDEIYRQILFEVLTNAMYHGPEEGGDVHITVERFQNKEWLVVENSYDKKLPRELEYGFDAWVPWKSMQQPGGISFINRLLNWTNSGEFRFKVKSKSKKFQSALYLKGVEAGG